MNVKGTAYLARRTYVARGHGAEAFDRIVTELSATHPIFADPIVATTRIPAASFIALNDTIVDRLYDRDDRSYYAFGEASAEWGLTVGPYKHFVAEKSVVGFVASVPTIYRSYFSEGACEAKLVGESQAVLRMSGISPPHVYFEYGTSGYFKRGLELVSGRSVTRQVRRGFSNGDPDVLHVLSLGGAREKA